MSMSHHESEMNNELLQRLIDQRDGKAKPEFPNGKISENDEGAIAFKISPDPEGKVVVLDFGKQVRCVGMRPEEAVQLAQMLIKHARAIATEPLRVVLS
jgi:hypothetical protein